MVRRSQSRRSETEETKEERLLRKAQEYIDAQERKSSSRHLGPDDAQQTRAKKKRESSSRNHDADHPRKRKVYRDEVGAHGNDKRDSRKRHNSEQRRSSNQRHREKEDRKRKKSSSRKGMILEKKQKHVKPKSRMLKALGDPLGNTPDQMLDAEKDYFAFHQHLWVYLHREEGRAFNDLNAAETRDAFSRFVSQYNAGKLEQAYYDPKGLPAAALEECKTTRHAWSFKVNETEERNLQHLQDGVRKQTEYHAGDMKEESSPIQLSSSAVIPSGRAVLEERPRRTAEDRYTDRVANHRLKQHIKAAEEDFYPRKEGRERQIEKRHDQAAKIHGAASGRDGAGVELTDEGIYGSDDRSFKIALAREQQRKFQREDQKQQRIKELQEKEAEKQKSMLKMLGLSGIQPGQKITILPRKNG